ncbi:MAG: glycosyltransferase family 2 protein [Burkholderiales bacterium]|nr:MAG: glycosyltransferase family 2 protein [Burkholderiales bacterium]
MILIPLYNHGQALSTLVERLLPHGLPIFIVDDGSDLATQDALAELKARYPALITRRLPENRGKGAAAVFGLREAFALGYTHALQIDADGQHDAAAVPRFIARTREFPEAIIAGVPRYDASVPRSRLLGRYFTHFWVWIETLSFAIGDSLCGCRVYPLAATVALVNSQAIGKRMDFDTEIIVRVVWRGLEVHNEALAVTYPLDGISHFDLWRDNLRISWLHTRLFFGMLPRSPLLLWRKFRRAPPRIAAVGTAPRHWAQLAERGASWGLQSVYWCYRWLGPRAARLLLLPVVAYFFLTGSAARRASLDYLRRLHRHGGPLPELAGEPGWRETSRHFFRFASAALDKVLAWRGELLAAQVKGADLEALDAAARQPRGTLVIGSHFGNLEVCRALAAHTGHRRINAVVHTAHAAKFAAVLARSNPEVGFKLLQVEDFGADTAILLREKIDAGEWLVIVADRTPVAENGRVVSASFLGAPALFPQGPFILAHLLQCPVYLLACFREPGCSDYRISFEAFAESVLLPRQGRDAAIAALAQRYAHWLERQCQRAPFEWFNFFDFWAPSAAPLVAGAGSGAEPLPHV